LPSASWQDRHFPAKIDLASIVSYFAWLTIGGTLASVRAPSRIALVLTALSSSACASPIAGPLLAAPLVAAGVRGPQALAAPTEDGSVYVLAEGGRLTSKPTLRSMWRRKASQTCDGDYLVLSEHDAQSRRAGVVSGNIHEGFVRCVSPEGAKPE
jgi:hypothetical protein